MLNLTHRETLVIRFLLITFVIGGALKLYDYYSVPEDSFSGALKKDSLKEKVKRNDEKYFQKKNSKQKDSFEKDTIGINTASRIKLQEINGIGPVKAKRIINYRQEHDQFESKNELKKIDGIGKKTLNKIKNEVNLE